MPKVQPNPRQFRNLIVTILLSSIVALPVFSQPLGLASVWTYPSADTEDTAVSTEDSPVLLNYSNFEIDSFSDIDDNLSRSIDELAPAKTAAASVSIEKLTPLEVIPPLEVILTEDSTAPLATAPAVSEPVIKAVYYVLYVKSTTLNLRSLPSAESEALFQFEFGAQVQCVGIIDDWMKVEFEDYVGFVKAEYTSTTVPYRDVNETVYVSSSKLNLRVEPSTDSEIIVKLAKNTKLTRTAMGLEWSLVKTSAGKVGYVANEYLTTKAPVIIVPKVVVSSGGTSVPATSSGTTVSGDAGGIVAAAYSALGVPYVYASSSMSGFDCSGLTSWVYRQIGISISRSSSGYYNIGESVAYENVQPGDVIAMDTRKGDGKTSITHVGIYVGGGQMIHASSTNKKVVITSLANYLNYTKLITIRRILS